MHFCLHSWLWMWLCSFFVLNVDVAISFHFENFSQSNNLDLCGLASVILELGMFGEKRKMLAKWDLESFHYFTVVYIFLKRGNVPSFSVILVFLHPYFLLSRNFPGMVFALLLKLEFSEIYDTSILCIADTFHWLDVTVSVPYIL